MTAVIMEGKRDDTRGTPYRCKYNILGRRR